MKRRRNPSQEFIAHYGKRLPYLVQDLDRQLRHADKQPAWPFDIKEAPRPPERIGERVDHWMAARRKAIIEVALMLMEASWVTPSMQKSRKSPYLPIVVQWYLNRSIRLPEDVPKTQETLLEFHQMVQNGILKGDNAKVEFQGTQQKLAKFLRAFKAGAKKGGLYEQDGCIRAGELGPYVLFRVDDFDTAKVVFDGTNWCVRNRGYFSQYGPPYWMVVDTDTKEDEDGRLCLLHAHSLQVKDVNDDPLDERTQKKIRPFLEFVFGKLACKYNMADSDGSDLRVGDQWWPFHASEMFGAVQEIIDVVYGIGEAISQFADEASMQCQDAVEGSLRTEYDEDKDGDYDEWIDKMRETARYNKLLGMAEDEYINSSDSRVDREAFSLVGGFVFDPEVALEVACPKVFGVSWDKLRKSLNIKSHIETRRRKDGMSYECRVGYYMGGNKRFSRKDITPKMELWAERSIDRFLALIPDEDDFRRYISRRNGAGLWKSLRFADRIAQGHA